MWRISGGIFDVDQKKNRISSIEHQLADATTWKTPELTKPLLKIRRQLKDDLALANRCRNSIEDVATLKELLLEGEDVEEDLKQELATLAKLVADTETRTLLGGKHDAGNAIVTIHPGAGGTESQDWAEMLLRMYQRWAEQHGYKTELTDLQPGDEAGIKSVTFLVKGDYAYGRLATEIGVHRLVRISPYDTGARRHTSFASVFVTPDLEDDVDIIIDEKDLRIDTYRSSGAGGQHVNVTDSAVRITHLSSGIVVQCQNERSQHRNKDLALKILRSKLYDLEMEEGKADIAWGNQIRSYVLQPYRQVKDHRTKIKRGNVDLVLDGDLDDFILEVLKQQAQLNATRKTSTQNEKTES